MTTPTPTEVHCYLCDTLGYTSDYVQMDFAGYIACVCPECMAVQEQHSSWTEMLTHRGITDEQADAEYDGRNA